MIQPLNTCFISLFARSLVRFCLGIGCLGIVLSASAAGELPEDATVVVAPMTRALWNQGRPFNRMCPLGIATNPDGRRWAGCTAIATAIVLDYYQWPARGEVWYQDLNDEKSWANDYSSVALRARFEEPYDWVAMRDVYGSVISGKASLAVARLVSDVGAVLHMNYGTEGSSTLRDNVPGVLEHNFHFDASQLYQINNDFTPTTQALIQKQLREGHPIISAGAAGAKGTGHTYVCDGYATTSSSRGAVTNLYHFNFGWGGTSNGWYPLDAVFTQSTASDTPYSRPVESMLLGVFPQREPQILSGSEATGPVVGLSWAVAACWTNRLTGFRLERQSRQLVTLNEDRTTSWNVRSSGWGWECDDGVPVAYAQYSWAGSYWPDNGVNATTTNALAVTKDTTISLTYQARKFPNGVRLRLIRSDADGSAYDMSNQPYPTIVELPGGSSTGSLEEKTVVVDGTRLLETCGSEPVFLALKFEDANDDKSYYGQVEVFRLTSFRVYGTSATWSPSRAVELSAHARTYAFTDEPAGEYNYVVTAKYADGEASAHMQKTVLSLAPSQPKISPPVLTGNTLVFEVAGVSNYTFSFETQSNVLRGNSTKSENYISYAFANDIAAVGTHWLSLHVTNTANGAVARYVYISNPPQDDPLCTDWEPSIEEATSRARREGKLVLLLTSGDPDATRFRPLAGILASNSVVSAIQGKYILAEALTATAQGYALGHRYWRGQPQVGYGSGVTAYQPMQTAYATVIDPAEPSVPYACDALPGYYMNAYSRWSYFNSQYDLPNLSYASGINSGIADLVRFLTQARMVVTVPPEESEAECILTPAETGEPVVGYVTNRIRVVYSVVDVEGTTDYDLTSLFVMSNTEAGVRLHLNPSAQFRLQSSLGVQEDIPVVPMLATLPFDDLVGETPFVVCAGVTVVGVKTIPGLTYQLMRSVSPDSAGEAVTSEMARETATSSRLRLLDLNRPNGRAFYRVRVSP